MARMSDMTRRDFSMSAALFAAFAGVAEAQTKAPNVLSTQRAYHYDELKMNVAASGAEGRAVMNGILPTGEALEVHETNLQPGQMPHPAHRHAHSELILVREGTLEFQNEDKIEHAGPGDVLFCASMLMHGVKNSGTTVAKYFVVAVGSEKAGAKS
jgi:quercetin dioxygenase-like cupin family protein